MKFRCGNCSYSIAPRTVVPNRCPYCGDTKLLREDAFNINKELTPVQ